MLDVDSDLCNEFLDNVHTRSLHPVINLPTRVTDTSSTLIDNFLCNFSLLPVCLSVIKTDISDHYLVELGLNTPLATLAKTRRDFSFKNKNKFTNKLCTAN